MRSASADLLLVEDDPAYVELTLNALHRANLNFQIHVARDGLEALNFLFCRENYSHRSFDEPPKVILLDLNLPGVDGFQVLREIKADHRTKSIPVVILTSSAMERDLVASYELGANSYVQKPLDFARFREAVRQLGTYWLQLNHAPPASSVHGPPPA